MTGRYLAFEGGEGSGKSTQAKRLAERLGAVLTREPGGTEVGARLRGLLLDPEIEGLDDRAEALLMAADRAQHLSTVVLPALDGGRDVVSDRSAYSTLAYQGFGRGIVTEELRSICDWACYGRWPDLVVLLDLPVGVGRERSEGDPDRMESAPLGFHQRVRDGYLTLARQEPHRWLVVDAEAPLERVEAQIMAGLADRLG